MSEAKKKRRKKRIQQRRGFSLNSVNWRRVSYGLLAGTALTLVGGTSWLWVSGWLPNQIDRTVERAYGFTADSGLRVQDVLVVGRNRTDAAAILTKLDVERGSPILGFSPREAKARLEELPWVKDAIVERRLPNVIFVQLEERRPLALWQENSELFVVDQGGDVIPGAQAAKFASLPLIVGPDAPEHAGEILTLIESEPDLKGLVKAAVRVSGRRWNLRLKNDVDVQLPAENPREAWAFFAQIERDEGVLARDVVLVDLRLGDRLIVRTSAGVKANKSKPVKGENT